MPGENIQDWSTSAVTNGNSDSSINWLEGQARASVNNSARSMMAAHAKQRDLTNGSITTTGTANVQAFVSGVSYTSVPTGLRVLLKIGTDLSNTGPATLNMDAIGDVAIKSRLGAELAAGEMVAGNYSEFRYDGTNWVLLSIGDTIVATTIITPIDGTITTTNIVTNTITTTGDVTVGGNIDVDGNITVDGDITTTNLYASTTVSAGRVQLIDGGSYTTVSLAVGYAFTLTPSLNISVTVGGGQVAAFMANGDLAISGVVIPSDARIKNVGGYYCNGLAAVRQLQPVHYTLKAAQDRERIGVVAQDVAKVMPELVTRQSDSDTLMLDPGALTYALVNCIKELAARLEALENR